MQARTKAARTKSDPPVDVLVARCSRESLEQLVIKAVASGALSVDELLHKLPELHRQRDISSTQITGGLERSGTGAFDVLSTELLETIMLHLAQHRRLTCVTAVCKSWRLLRANTVVWQRLLFGGVWGTRACAIPGAAPDKARLQHFIKAVVEAVGPSVSELCLDSSWLGEIVPVESVRLCLQKLPALQRLSLDGTKITGALLTMCTKQPFVKNLLSLEFGNITANQMDPGSLDAAIKTIGAATQLQDLAIPSSWAKASHLANIAHAVRVARGGAAVPLLRRLVVSEGSGIWQYKELASLGELFPELESISIHEGYCFETKIEPFSPMARLKHLSLGYVSGGFREPPSTGVLTALLCSVLPVCPALQALQLCARHYMCPKDSELAQLSDATPLPQSLKLLQLGYTSVPSAFPGIQLPALQTVRMRGCGLHAAALFDSLRSHASQLPAMQSLDMGDTVATSQHPTDWIWRNHYQRPLADNK